MTDRADRREIVVVHTGQVHHPATVIAQDLPDLHNQVGTIAVRAQRGAGCDAARRTHEGLPSTIWSALEQQHLDRTTGRLPQREPGRDHPRVVHHEQVIRSNERREVGDVPMI
mgnify:CR=1 FL=1